MSYILSRCHIVAPAAGFILLLAIAWANATGMVTIAANPGKFDSIETTARSEEQVNWQADDKSDDNACTESLAAYYDR